MSVTTTLSSKQQQNAPDTYPCYETSNFFQLHNPSCAAPSTAPNEAASSPFWTEDVRTRRLPEFMSKLLIESASVCAVPLAPFLSPSPDSLHTVFRWWFRR